MKSLAQGLIASKWRNRDINSGYCQTLQVNVFVSIREKFWWRKRIMLMGIKVLMRRWNKTPRLKRPCIIVGVIWPVSNRTFDLKRLKQWKFIISSLSPEASISRAGSFSSTTSRNEALLCTSWYSPVGLSPHGCKMAATAQGITSSYHSVHRWKVKFLLQCLLSIRKENLS